MRKGKYVRFGKGVSKKIEREYNKMLRHEEYLEECDRKNGLLHIEDCTFLPYYDSLTLEIADPDTLPLSASDQVWQDRIEYLPTALEQLKRLNPKYYDVLTEYYLSDEKVTLKDLAAKHGVTYQAIHSTLRQARWKMKMIIMRHENGRDYLCNPTNFRKLKK